MRTLGLFVLGLLLAVSASAQVTNPSAVVFDHTDFATATSYEGGYFAMTVKADRTCDAAATPAVSPTQTDVWAKPATTTGIAMSATLVARPIGCWIMRVRAIDASGLASDWSLPSDLFLRKSAAPGKPTHK